MKADKVLELINKLLDEGSTGYFVELLSMREECKSEIATATAKASGGNDEVKRKKAAERIFKNAGVREVLRGYKQYEDGKIALTDGYIAYYGKPIAGITETKFPNDFPDVPKLISGLHNYIEHKIDLAEIKTNYKIAQVEAKSKKIKSCIYNYVEGANIALDNGTNTKTHLASEYIITACELLGGDEFTIKISSNWSAPVSIENENGIALVCPFRPKELDNQKTA